MKYSIFLIIVWVSFISSEESESNLPSKDFCIYAGNKLKHLEEGPAPVGTCASCKCYIGDKGQQSLSCKTCAVFEVTEESKCIITENLELRYPDCCPKAVCPDSDKS